MRERRNFSVSVQPAQVILVIDPARFKELCTLRATASEYWGRRTIVVDGAVAYLVSLGAPNKSPRHHRDGNLDGGEICHMITPLPTNLTFFSVENLSTLRTATTYNRYVIPLFAR
jgi:hypothetical protein